MTILKGQIQTDNGDILYPQTTADIVFDKNGKSVESHLADMTKNVPPGTVIYFANATSPTGYLKANGALVSRSTYADLFAAIGTTFGNGDGSTTFQLPDLRGEFVRGFDDGRGVDSGRTFGSVQDSNNKQHTHSVGVNIEGGSGWCQTLKGNSSATSSTYYESTSMAITTASGGAEARPRNIALLPCIKY